jgi:hypothetical protein
MVILSVLGFISVPLFGFIVFKLQKNFVQRETFDNAMHMIERQRIEAQNRADRERSEILNKVNEIDQNVIMILKMKVDEVTPKGGRR